MYLAKTSQISNIIWGAADYQFLSLYKPTPEEAGRFIQLWFEDMEPHINYTRLHARMSGGQDNYNKYYLTNVLELGIAAWGADFYNDKNSVDQWRIHYYSPTIRRLVESTPLNMPGGNLRYYCQLAMITNSESVNGVWARRTQHYRRDSYDRHNHGEFGMTKEEMQLVVSDIEPVLETGLLIKWGDYYYWPGARTRHLLLNSNKELHIMSSDALEIGRLKQRRRQNAG